MRLEPPEEVVLSGSWPSSFSCPSLSGRTCRLVPIIRDANVVGSLLLLVLVSDLE